MVTSEEMRRGCLSLCPAAFREAKFHREKWGKFSDTKITDKTFSFSIL